MDSSGGCPRHFNSCGESLQSKLDSPMPWVGMYIAAASAFVTIAMAADIFYGFKNKKWWLPSKYLSMNAFSLTVLAISMKLPVDLTNQMLKANEILARVSSLALMSTVMGNLMTSLGAMEFNDMMLNLASIGTLVITIVVNVSIHISRMLDNVGKDFRGAVISQIYSEQIICTVIMFILFLMLCYWSVALPLLRTAVVDRVYRFLNEETSTKRVKWGDCIIDEQRGMLRDYWMNARIGNPQFLIARSDISAASGAMCLLTALMLLKAWIRMHFVYNGVNIAASNYKWSINWILIIQTIGVGLGTIAPVFRWFLAAKLNSSSINYCFKVNFVQHFSAVEAFIRWVRAPLSLNIPYPKFRYFVKTAKVIFSIFYIIPLILIVLASNLLLLVSAECVRVILLCFPHDESIEEINEAFMILCYEEELSNYSTESISNEVNKLIEMGRKKQPKDLIKLLHKSGNFNGVKEFVNKPILWPYDALNCWSLAIVILTSIAVQLPNITTDKIAELKRGVAEGLRFVKLIEKSFNANLERYKFRLGAEELWSDVQIFGHCVIINVKRQSYRETLQALAERAADLKRSDSSEEIDPDNEIFWSFKKAASISADHICSAIIKLNKENDGETEEDFFERLSIMISDIISACLTNLTPLITFWCSDSAINEREENVRKAAILFGETEVILEMLLKHKLPGLDPKKAAHLNEWRVFMEQNPNWMASMEKDIEPKLDEEPVTEIE